jgi:hypothetical protein
LTALAFLTVTQRKRARYIPVKARGNTLSSILRGALCITNEQIANAPLHVICHRIVDARIGRAPRSAGSDDNISKVRKAFRANNGSIAVKVDANPLSKSTDTFMSAGIVTKPSPQANAALTLCFLALFRLAKSPNKTKRNRATSVTTDKHKIKETIAIYQIPTWIDSI